LKGQKARQIKNRKRCTKEEKHTAKQEKEINRETEAFELDKQIKEVISFNDIEEELPSNQNRERRLGRLGNKGLSEIYFRG